MADAAEPGNVAADLFARLAADPLARHLGITLEQVRPGYARASMTAPMKWEKSVGSPTEIASVSATRSSFSRAQSERGT